MRAKKLRNLCHKSFISLAILPLSLITLGMMFFVTHPSNFATDFYASASGHDSWPGKLAIVAKDGLGGPFATLEKARDGVRKLRQSEPDRKTSIVIQIEEEQYHL